MSEIFYAGGTTTKDISAHNLIEDLQALHKNAFFVADRNQLLEAMRPHFYGRLRVVAYGCKRPFS